MKIPMKVSVKIFTKYSRQQNRAKLLHHYTWECWCLEQFYIVALCRRAVTSALKRDQMSAHECPDHYWDGLSKRCARPLVSTLDRLCPLDALTANWTLTDHSAINRTCM